MNIVITVLRSGGEYNEEHVHALFRNLTRSLSVPFEFQVLTDSRDIAKSMALPLRHDWPGWWSKLELFRPGLFRQDDRVVYMDLDTVLVGNVDWLFDFTGSMMMANGPMMILRGFRKPRWASGLMAWQGEPAASLAYHKFLGDPAHYMKRHKAGGDQEFMMATLRDRIKWEYWERQFPKTAIASYKRNVLLNKDMLPLPDTVVCFHGLPRPWDVDAGWIRGARA